MQRASRHLIVVALLGCISLASCSMTGAGGPAGGSRVGPSVKNVRPTASSPVLYVLNFSSYSVTEYPAGSSGDTPPLRMIAGQNTEIFSPTGMAVDGSGEIFVSDRCLPRFNALGKVVVFSPLADGDVPPTRVLLLASAICDLGMWADAAGYLYLPEKDDSNRSHEVAVFAPGASGMAQPVRVIVGADTRFRCPTGVTTDSGGDLYVADQCAKAILEFSPTADGDSAPIAIIKGSKTMLQGPTDVKVGSDGKVYAVDTGVIDVFAAGANANVAPVTVVSPPISHFGVTFIGGIAIHGADLIAGINPPYNWGVSTYKTGSTIVLLRTIAGRDTELDGPEHEAVY